MRDILVKAKRLDNGEWVEGCLLVDGLTGQYFIHANGNSVNESDKVGEEGCLQFFAFEVEPSTVCQWTGLKDINGNKVYEGDILKGFNYPYLSEGHHNYFAEIVWFDNCPAFGIYIRKNPKSFVQGISAGLTDFIEDFNSKDWKVIGNIFDNPELLEGGGN